MANQTPLASWLYSKRQELNPRFKEFSWPDRVFPGLYDFSTTIYWNGVEAKGRGVDSRREIALEKSVSEAIERLICKSLGFDSVGFALAGAHDPTDHAKFEALERFFLKKHLDAKIPFHHISIENEDVLKFRKQNPESTIRFFRMQTSNELHGVVCAMKHTASNKTALGFGLSDSQEKSMQRSMREALPNFAWFSDEDNEPVEEMPWHIDQKFLSRIEPLFVDTASEDQDLIPQLPTLSRVDVEKSAVPILSSAPIQMARYCVNNEGAR